MLEHHRERDDIRRAHPSRSKPVAIHGHAVRVTFLTVLSLFRHYGSRGRDPVGKASLQQGVAVDGGETGVRLSQQDTQVHNTLTVVGHATDASAIRIPPKICIHKVEPIGHHGVSCCAVVAACNVERIPHIICLLQMLLAFTSFSQQGVHGVTAVDPWIAAQLVRTRLQALRTDKPLETSVRLLPCQHLELALNIHLEFALVVRSKVHRRVCSEPLHNVTVLVAAVCLHGHAHLIDVIVAAC